jgi:GxxExxY protein
VKSREELEHLATEVVDAAYRVHSTLGPGLLESAYQACLMHELRTRGFEVECEVPFPVRYSNLILDIGYRVDLVVEGELLIENKAVATAAPIHGAQLLTYLKLSGRRLGLLINWNVPRIRDGIRRLVNGL